MDFQNVSVETGALIALLERREVEAINIWSNRSRRGL
jgi:hypothetical protein